MPRLNDIQEALGLQSNTKRFLGIRKYASRLLQSAGLLFHRANDISVQNAKRVLANKLEQNFPEVFGVTTGINRDFALQKDTSYALLTLAMDTARRATKRKGQPGDRAQARKSRNLPHASLSRSNASAYQEGLQLRVRHRSHLARDMLGDRSRASHQRLN